MQYIFNCIDKVRIFNSRRYDRKKADLIYALIMQMLYS